MKWKIKLLFKNPHKIEFLIFEGRTNIWEKIFKKKYQKSEVNYHEKISEFYYLHQ